MAIASRRRVGDRVVAFIRLLLCTSYIGVVLLGIVVAPTSALAWGVVPAALGAVGFGALHRVCLESWPTRRRMMIVLLYGAGFVPFMAAINALGSAGGVMFVGIAALAIAAAVQWGYSLVPPEVNTEVSYLPSTTGQPSLHQLLEVLPLDVLASEWRASAAQFDRSSTAQLEIAIAEFRELLLAEMQRRDPIGVDRWLTDGAVRPLEHYIRDQGATDDGRPFGAY